MSPEEYQKQIKESLNSLLSTEYSIQNDIKHIVKAVKTEALGMEFDSWGNIVSGKDYIFFQQIIEDNKGIIEEYRKDMRKQINLQLQKKTSKLGTQKINDMFNKILWETLNEELQIVREEIKTLAKKQIKEEFKPWYALQNLIEAANL